MHPTDGLGVVAEVAMAVTGEVIEFQASGMHAAPISLPGETFVVQQHFV